MVYVRAGKPHVVQWKVIGYEAADAGRYTGA